MLESLKKAIEISKQTKKPQTINLTPKNPNPRMIKPKKSNKLTHHYINKQKIDPFI